MTTTRDATKWPNCSCGTTWRQSGNRTGHCSGCHRTFQGLGAFDKHRSDGWCLDPRAMTARDGTYVYDVALGAGEHDQGVEYWSIHVSDEQRAAFAALNAHRAAS